MKDKYYGKNKEQKCGGHVAKNILTSIKSNVANTCVNSIPKMTVVIVLTVGGNLDGDMRTYSGALIFSNADNLFSLIW